MAIFIPPAVFGEEDAVFDLPVITNVGQQFLGPELTGIDASQEVTRVVQAHGAIVGRDVAIECRTPRGFRGSST
ncbi:hypothetical protein [Anatilimnocola aggregata]|uniref:hypothetical protein n=1 Tax=Anatilimnocola aggregata TaxID=2528021 RepID=UPI0011A4DBE5|nr:hypothetical protein [Anatilimnocola aggregata]